MVMAPQQRTPKPQVPADHPQTRVAVKRIFHAESANYFLLLGTTLFLVLLGLIMVLSSSSIESFASTGDAFGQLWKHVLFMSFGIPTMLIASRLPTTFWKKWAVLFLGVAVGLQLLVFTSLGIEVNNNRNWLGIGSFTLQPSEFIKLTLILWLGMLLAKRQPLKPGWQDALVPALVVSGAAIGLVMAGDDLGTVMILVSVLLGCLYFAGVRFRYLFTIVGVGGALALIFAVSSPNRLYRLQAFFSPGTVDYEGAGWQITHASFALASGGIFGVGLGNSKSKWLWLPEADNDMIFAVIGEELGLIGAVLVLALFVLLAVCFVRIIAASDDPFVRIVTGGVMVWVVGQALVNIAVVLQVLPVLGVPLPLISAGGSATLATLLAIGVVLSFARGQRKQPDGPGR